MPNLTIVILPSDHTSGTSEGWCTPSASVAGNDLALGKIVEGLSHSSFWPSMAIMVVEDDAQNGVDHIDVRSAERSHELASRRRASRPGWTSTNPMPRHRID